MLLDSTDDAVIWECRSKVLKLDQRSKMFEIYSVYLASSVLSHKAYKKTGRFLHFISSFLKIKNEVAYIKTLVVASLTVTSQL